MERDTLVISIDFGTTYTGVAYALKSQPHKIEFLCKWPGKAANAAIYKVPTVVSYPVDGSEPLWGFKGQNPRDYTPQTYTRCTAFKPFLDEGSRPGNCRLPPGKTVEGVVTDFMEFLYQHLILVLQEENLSSRDLDYEFLITVPATYTQVTVEKFRRIINKTGIGKHHAFEVNLTEPEAASIYVILRQPRTHFVPGQAFVVCDAGGGTVDLCSYTIRSTAGHPKLDQTGVITGDTCGSAEIDRRFEDHLVSRIGASAIHTLSNEEWGVMLDEFIQRKELFSDDPTVRYYYIRLPRENLPCRGREGVYLPISREEMRGFFDPSVDRILELVKNHIDSCRNQNKSIQYVYLVGGFGTSPYLKARLENFVLQHNLQIQVISPRSAQQAVVEGANMTLMQRLRKEEDPVASRLFRASYGVVATTRFNPQQHKPEDKFVHPITKEVLAKNQISWLVKRGHRFEGAPEKAIQRELKRSFKKAGIWTEIIVCYNGPDEPPHDFSNGVRELCRIQSDLSGCPTTEFQKVRKPGGFLCFGTRYYEARYQVRMIVGMSDVKFETFFQGGVRSGVLSLKWAELDEGA